MRTTICNHACMIYWSVTDFVCVLHTGDAVASYSCRTMRFWCIGGLGNKDQRDTAHGTHNVARWSSWPSGYEHDFASEASSESFNSLNYYPRCSAQHLTSPKACLSPTTNLFLIRCDIDVWPGPSLGKRLGPSGKLKVYLNLLNVYLTHLLGLFTVAILGPFSAHFQTHFRLIFVCLAEKQTKGNEKWDEKWCEKWLPWNPWNGN